MPSQVSYSTQKTADQVQQNATTLNTVNETAQNNVNLVQSEDQLNEEKVLPKSSPTGGSIDLGGDETEESLIQSDVQQNTTQTSNKTKEFQEKNDDIQRKIDLLQT